MIDLRRLADNLLHRDKPSPMPANVFGYAVIGLGRIAEHFLRGVADSPTVRATALVSGDPAKAEKLAKRYGVYHTCGYADIDSLRNRPDVHAVYIALPVSMHRDFTAHAAMAGKHVFVEKPMASDVAESQQMIADCRAAGVLLSVAYRCPYDPMHQHLRSLIAEGALGTVQRIDSTFGFPLAADDWRFNPGLAGGGSAYDVGVYPLNAARFLMQSEPAITAAKATTNADGMETSIDWTSTFPNGAEAHCRSSYLERMPGALTVRGTAGELTLDPAFSHREPVRLRGWYTDPTTGDRKQIDTATPADTPNHFRLEAEHLAICARNNTPLLTPGEDGLRDMELIADMYRIAGVPQTDNATHCAPRS